MFLCSACGRVRIKGHLLHLFTHKIIMVLAYNKQQYCIRVASDYRERDHWILSMHSPERRRHRRRLLLRLNRRKVEVFIHSVIYFVGLYVRHSKVSQIIDDFCRIRHNSDVRFERAYCWRRKGPKQDL